MRRETTRRGGRRFFTLIEMLVVIAIIAILAAMLSPSLMKALDAARAVACLNNIKQTGLALNTYAGDFNGWIPGSQIYGKGTMGIGAPWTALLTDASDRETIPLAGNYVGDVKVMYCPVSSFPGSGYGSGGPGYWGGWTKTYGMAGLDQWTIWGGNLVRAWIADKGSANTWTRLYAVPSPAGKPLVGDTADRKNDFNPGTPRGIFEWRPDKVSDGWSLHARHQERVNLWFADGHAAPVPGYDLQDKYQIKAFTAGNGDPIGWVRD